MSTDVGTKVRGTVIKVPDASPGLLFVNGGQAPFTLEGRWHSPVAPAANMVVDVILDGSGGVVAIAVVDTQQLAKKRLNQLGDVAQQQGKVAADMARQGVGALAARMGTATLVATVALWIAWFFLPAVSVEFLVISRSFTFWELLGLNPARLASEGAASHGLFDLVGLAAIAAPFAAPFSAHPRAKLLNALPLAYLLLTVINFGWQVRRTLRSVGGGGEFFQEATGSAMSQVFDVLSIGAGVYIIIVAALFLGVKAMRR